MMESRLVVDPGSITKIRFVDENLIEETVIRMVGREIEEIIERDPAPKLVISFENVIHLSSSALGVLIKANNLIKEKDGQLRLCNINDQIYEAFLITNLNQLLSIHKTSEEALASLK